jgi:hypothetical protein
MDPTISRGTVAGLTRLAAIVSVMMFCTVGPSQVAHAGNAPQIPTDGNTKAILFNLTPSTSYSIVKNSAPLTTANTSQTGTAVYVDVSTSGDRYEIAESGAGAQEPAAPIGVAAVGDDTGCASLQWNANLEPDVDYYRVYRGSAPGSYVDSLDVMGATAKTICELANGTHYFSLRAHNTAGLLSALSLEVSAFVSNGSTQPPLPPGFVDANEGNAGCLDVSWVPNGSPDVVGYVVDYGTQSVAGGQVSSYEHTVDVGNSTSHTICGLADGTYYVAVRSKNFADMLSAFSPEDTAILVPTAIFITAFSAKAVASGVKLTWDIWTDETLGGYKVYRSRKQGGDGIVLNGGRPIDPSLSTWFDHSVEPVTTYLYTLVVIGEGGVEHRSSVEQVTTHALSMALEQNVPNPFNPSTSISFVVPKSSRVVLAVYDVTGSLVRRLIDEAVPSGRRTVQWDGTNNRDEPVSSGTYFYRLTVGKRSDSRKMLLLK